MKKYQSTTETLETLISRNSKHSNYQGLHPWLCNVVGVDFQLAVGKKEAERQAYMQSNLSMSGRTVLDIGANTGYFSFAALHAGAEQVTAIEGNADHAGFIKQAARCLGVEQQLLVRDSYYEFQNADDDHYDIILCLNVLHHLGDDFGDQRISLDDAKARMAHSLQSLASKGKWLWFQLGYNWKGDRNKPIFPHGTKTEMIDFVFRACKECWRIEKVALWNPESRVYDDVQDGLLTRYDYLGEFLNRPLFLLRSLKKNS